MPVCHRGRHGRDQRSPVFSIPTDDSEGSPMLHVVSLRMHSGRGRGYPKKPPLDEGDPTIVICQPAASGPRDQSEQRPQPMEVGEAPAERDQCGDAAAQPPADIGMASASALSGGSVFVNETLPCPGPQNDSAAVGPLERPPLHDFGALRSGATNALRHAGVCTLAEFEERGLSV